LDGKTREEAVKLFKEFEHECELCIQTNAERSILDVQNANNHGRNPSVLGQIFFLNEKYHIHRYWLLKSTIFLELIFGLIKPF
jgi:hypothetical protein